ncbi:hypothetical protein PsorP6_007830 [Peronosclerospora sorghi]|uniref:Uncharacterized protein n=1 Tax=Peronosclerospora sorghi TaxID=230839 RepID=A0ACC0W9C6_9STRA|nr:hypothetical protein PsorP6_007830 [Peronosclerospora sorghi]
MMLKLHVLVLISCCFAAASVRAAIRSTDAAAVLVDQSNHRVDPSEHRDLGAKVPDGSEDERARLSEAQLQAIANVVPQGFSVELLQKVQQINLLDRLRIGLKDASESYAVIQLIVPFVQEQPMNRIWMAFGGAYFKGWYVNVPSAVNALDPTYREIEENLARILKIYQIDPTRGIYKFRWIVNKHNGEGIPSDTFSSMVQGSEIMERKVLLQASIMKHLDPSRVQSVMEEIRKSPLNLVKSESELLKEAINKAMGEYLSLKPSADFN